MKKLIMLVLLTSTLLFAEQGVVLHPNLSYRSADDLGKWLDTHTFGSTVELTGETTVFDDTKYKLFELDGKQYGSYYFYLIDNSVPGVITNQTFTFKYNDFSSITAEKIDPLQFVAIDKSTLNKPLVKVSYLVLDKENKPNNVLSTWVNSSDVSQTSDDVGTAIKFFNAKISDDADMVKRNLTLITKKHKSSVFIEQISDMLNNSHLNVLAEESEIDEYFNGSNDYLVQEYTGKIYKDANLSSTILSEETTKIKLLKKTKEMVTDGDKSDYMYLVETGTIQGWIFGL